MISRKNLITVLIAFVVLPLVCHSSLAGKQAVEKTVPDPVNFVTQHQGNFNGKNVRYTVTAGEIFLTNDQEEPTAAIWSIAYTKDIAELGRPVTFVFNGGPGSASVWLHMGLFGPRRIKVASEADADDGAAPYQLVPNPLSPLDITDLVFIDPVGTGFSRALGKSKDEDFWGLIPDARSVAQFIRRWITIHQRWNSPRYIAGESFGTTRAATVADILSGDGQDVALNGLILISQALDYTGSTPAHDNLISYITYLPTMAATARYHGRAGKDQSLEDFIESARQFAFNEYAPALFKGSRLKNSERKRIAERLAYFTGLDEAYILYADLRVLSPRFRKELLRDKGLAIGRLDGRYLRDDIDDTAARPESDAASDAISSAYTAGINHYLATELKVKIDRPYLTSNRSLGGKWRWRPVSESQRWEPSYVNVARRLSSALRRNADLRVLVANGYYDFATPFFDAEFTLSRHGILPERITMKYYEAGHMMYVHEPDLKKLAEDIRSFLISHPARADKK
jgi:carboxypeptidase C (cathepsin A)